MLWVIGYAILLVFGCIWCLEVLKRFGSDVQEFKEGKAADKAVIVFFWFLTLGIMYLIGAFVWRLVRNILHML